MLTIINFKIKQYYSQVYKLKNHFALTSREYLTAA